MSDEAMLECFGNATICVFAADYAEVTNASILIFLVTFVVGGGDDDNGRSSTDFWRRAQRRGRAFTINFFFFVLRIPDSKHLGLGCNKPSLPSSPPPKKSKIFIL